jgi:Na+/H+ antiporter NhaD/arsenite permease-like protein
MSINPGVMLFLLGCLLLVKSKELRFFGELYQRICRYAPSGDILLILIIVTMGQLSAVLMNDTIAIIGAPLILILAERSGSPNPAP